MIKSRLRLHKLGLTAIDLIFSSLAALLAFYIRKTGLISSKPFLQETDYFLVSIFFILLQIAVFASVGVYNVQKRLNFWSQAVILVRAVVISSLVFTGILFLAKINLFSRGFFGYLLIFDLLLVGLNHYFYRKFLLYRKMKSGQLRQIWLVGHSKAGIEFLTRIGSNLSYGYQVTRVYADGSKASIEKRFSKITQFNNSTQIFNSTKKLFKDIQIEQPEIIIYSNAEDDRDFLYSIINLGDDWGVQINLLPDFSGLLAHNSFIEMVEGMPLISVQNIPLQRGYNWMWKRIFDIAFSSAAIIAITPILIFTAFLIKVKDRGPIFFIQKRLGLDNKPFTIIKFRTMEVQETSRSDETWGASDDPRVTSVGKYLRKFNIDELPQFFNVLKGDMSIVGPRPERPHFVNQFRKDIHRYMRRHQVKAGITGLAQVSGLRGDTSIQKRVEADIYYIENWSLLMDIRIIFLSVLKQFYNKNA